MDETPDKPTESDIKNIEKILAKVKKTVAKPRKKGKSLEMQEKIQLSTAISSALSEYLDCYIICGFDVHGNSTILINVANNMESRAVADLMEDFLESGTWGSGMFQREDDPDN